MSFEAYYLFRLYSHQTVPASWACNQSAELILSPCKFGKKEFPGRELPRLHYAFCDLRQLPTDKCVGGTRQPRLSGCKCNEPEEVKNEMGAYLQQEPQVPFLQVRLHLWVYLATASLSSHRLCAPNQSSELPSLSRMTLFCFCSSIGACSLVFLFRLQKGIHTFFRQPRVMVQKVHSAFTKGSCITRLGGLWVMSGLSFASHWETRTSHPSPSMCQDAFCPVEEWAPSG